MLHTFAAPMPARDAIRIFREVTGRERFSVVLDMKSLHSTPELFAGLIAHLNRQCIHVTAACSFKRKEIAGLADITQHVDGAELPGPREVLFFHFAGDLQIACDAGEIPRGQSVLFNGASLLSVDGWFSENPQYAVLKAVVADLARYQQRLDLDIGLYVQEGDCDRAAAALLSALVEQNEHTFRLGFAWGGLPGENAFEPVGEPRMGHGSQLTLTFVGESRQCGPARRRLITAC